MNFFDINNIFFKIFEYNLSYLEFFGVITGLLGVYFAAKEKVSNFYFIILSSICYFAFFYQCQLYSLMILQLIYCVINIYGIYSWTRCNEKKERIKITVLSNIQRIYIILLIIFIAVFWAYFMVNISVKFPKYIEMPKYPYIDALITIASIIAQILLTRKKIDNWVIWIIADTTCIILYCIVGIYFTAVLYAFFLVIGTNALIAWKKELKYSNQ